METFLCIISDYQKNYPGNQGKDLSFVFCKNGAAGAVKEIRGAGSRLSKREMVKKNKRNINKKFTEIFLFHVGLDNKTKEG